MNFRCNTQGKQTLSHLWSTFQQLLTTAHRRGDVVQKGIELQTADHLQAAFTLQAFGRQIQCMSEGLQGSTNVVQSQICISQAQKCQRLQREKQHRIESQNILQLKYVHCFKLKQTRKTPVNLHPPKFVWIEFRKLLKQGLPILRMEN